MKIPVHYEMNMHFSLCNMNALNFPQKVIPEQKVANYPNTLFTANVSLCKKEHAIFLFYFFTISPSCVFGQGVNMKAIKYFSGLKDYIKI